MDLSVYTQGYLALALASVEHHNGQMVTSDIETAVTIYGQGAQPVTDEVMQREVCRAAGNPVCGDPGVLPVTSSGCPCFDRGDVRYRMIGTSPKRLLTSYYLYQGMVDAERDLPGSTFRWKVYDNPEIFAVLAEYAEVANGTFFRGVISADAYLADISSAMLAAIRSIPESGKPLYMGYLHGALPGEILSFLDRFQARSYVGYSVVTAGRFIADLAKDVHGQHVLVHNIGGYLPLIWHWIKAIVATSVGEGYPFPPNIWDFPPTARGSPVNRTGAWALFTDPLTNRTAQVMEGLDIFLGDAFLKPLYERLAGERGGPAPTDTLVMAAYTSFMGQITLPMLAQLAREQPERPPVRMITHKCTDLEYSALLRWNLTAHEEFVLGCLDEQVYLSSYLSATIAALEQQTSERIVGEVRTERLLRYDHLPLKYPWRVACERANYQQFTKGILGQFNPLCDVRQGCVKGGMSAPKNATTCSGHGTCQFSKEAPAGTTDGSQGTCLCARGWTGPFCTDRIQTEDEKEGHRRRILLAVLLSCGIALVIVGLLLVLRLARLSRTDAHRDPGTVEALEVSRWESGEDSTITVVVMDVDRLADLLAWDAGETKKALEVFQAAVRSLLHEYHGQEISAPEGAFTLAFHDPVKALSMVMDLQHGLLHPRALVLNDPPASSLAALKHFRRSISSPQSDWPTLLLSHDHGAEARCPSGQSMLYRGLRVRVGIHVGVPEVPHGSSKGKQQYEGEYVDVARAIRDIALGGQVLLSMQAWRSLGMHMTSTVCHHMGIHKLAEGLPPIHLMQVLPEELAKRAPFPPLKSIKQLGPSFFDAPAAECYVKGEPPKDPVVIAFMYVAYAKTLRKTPGYQGGVDLLVAFVQSRLAEFEAYEVEEKEGNFLLAFRSAAKAVQFAETIQREAMDLPWSPKLLEEEQAAEVVKPALPSVEGSLAKEMVVFRGLRLQIGMCMEMPSDCQPHMATGRAAYFGPVVNRAARIAATAAPGQTLVNFECFATARDSCGPMLFNELGQYQLKGIKQPMHLYQVASAELSVRLFPRTLKLANVSEPMVAFDTTAPGAGEKSVADGFRLPPHLALTISPNAKTTRKSMSMRMSVGEQQLLPMARHDENVARHDNRISRLLMSLAAAAEPEEGEESPPVRPANLGHRGRVLRTSDENPPQGRRSGESTHVSMDDVLYDEMSYDELSKLAVKQHAEIKAMRKLALAHMSGN
eukprot:jgi/Mesvir1/22913/Mv19431-RA.2